MKLLLFYTHDFWMKPHHKALVDAPDAEGEMARQGAVVAWVHCEPGDVPEEARGRVVTRAVKQLKWLAGKFGTRTVVLHFFAHLAGESAAPEAARALVEALRQRLAAVAYDVLVTPFGYFHEFRMHVGGESLAKVFVDIPAR